MQPLKVLGFCICIATCCFSTTQDTKIKIGFLMPHRIIENSARCKQMFIDMESTKKEAERRLLLLSEEINKLNDQLKSPSLSETGKENIQKQLRDLHFNYKKNQEDERINLQKVEQQITTQLENEIMPIVNELAKEQQLQLVLQLQPELIAYAESNYAFGFSDEIVKRYDSKYKTLSNNINK